MKIKKDQVSTLLLAMTPKRQVLGDGARRGGGHGEGRARRGAARRWVTARRHGEEAAMGHGEEAGTARAGRGEGMGHDEGSACVRAARRGVRACVQAARRACVRACGREARRGECGRRGGGAVIQNSETSEREAAGERPGRFRASIFVGLTEDDENSGRSMTYFRRYGPGPRKYSTFSSVMRPTKITSIFLWACRRTYSPAHKNTPHFRRSRGRRK
jgi:hypothetical protein